MKLHEYPELFAEVLELISTQSGYPAEVLEKDYLLTLLLTEVSKKQEKMPIIFKGGSALYKTLKMANRMSEDIDLTINTEQYPNNNQKKKALNEATKEYVSLLRDKEKGVTNKQEVIAFFNYKSVITSSFGDNFLEKFTNIQIETTSFTSNEPSTEIKIAPLIYDYATSAQKKILEIKFDIRPFPIKILTLSRMFIDKLYAAEAYTRRMKEFPDKAMSVAKHMYDLTILSTHPEIRELIKDEDYMKYLLDIQTKEELKRLSGIPNVNPKDFIFFNSLHDEKIMIGYNIMESKYIFKAEDKIPLKIVIQTMRDLQEDLFSNLSWRTFECQKDSNEKIIEESGLSPC